MPSVRRYVGRVVIGKMGLTIPRLDPPPLPPGLRPHTTFATSPGRRLAWHERSAGHP